MIKYRFDRLAALVLACGSFAAPVFAQQPTTANPANAEAMFASLDTSKDGTVSRDEWTAGGQKTKGFARVDRNTDGKITIEEVRVAQAAMAKRAAGAVNPPS